MSTAITEMFKQEFYDNVLLLAQQEFSVLRPCVDVKTGYTGKAVTPVRFVGEFDLVEKTGRMEPTPIFDTNHFKPWIRPRSFHGGPAIDWDDVLRSGPGIDSAYVRSLASASGRKWDDFILFAFFSPVYYGEEGASTQNFDTDTHQVAVTAGGSSATGYNTAKIEKALQIISEDDINLLNGNIQVYGLLDPIANAQLKKDLKIVNSDYDKLGTIVKSGLVIEHQGVKFVHMNFVKNSRFSSTASLVDGNNVKYPIWVKNKMHLGIWKDYEMDLITRSDLSMAKQFYAKLSGGATRLEKSVGVVQVLADKTK